MDMGWSRDAIASKNWMFTFKPPRAAIIPGLVPIDYKSSLNLNLNLPVTKSIHSEFISIVHRTAK